MAQRSITYPLRETCSRLRLCHTDNNEIIRSLKLDNDNGTKTSHIPATPHRANTDLTRSNVGLDDVCTSGAFSVFATTCALWQTK
jgi:hypothetical protein